MFDNAQAEYINKSTSHKNTNHIKKPTTTKTHKKINNFLEYIHCDWHTRQSPWPRPSSPHTSPAPDTLVGLAAVGALGEGFAASGVAALDFGVAIFTHAFFYVLFFMGAMVVMVVVEGWDG